jgi:hypothetical protein
MAKKKVEVKADEPKVVEPKVVAKVTDKFFADKRVLSEYEKDGGKFVVLEGGETIKL